MQVKTLKILIMLAFLSIQLNGVSYGSWSVDDDLDEQVIEEEKTNVLSEEDIVEKLELAKKNKRTIKCYDGHPICSHGGVAKCKGDYPPVCIGGEVSCCRNYNGSLNCDEFGEEVNLAINHSVNCVSAEKKKKEFTKSVVGDFNNDDSEDLAYLDQKSGSWFVGTVGSNKGNFTLKTFGKWSPTATWNNILVADFDGDGFKDDIVGRIQATSDLWVSISDGETFTNKKFGFWPKAFIWVDALVGDFDQDGEIDDLAGRASNGTWIVSFSDGKKFKNKIFGHWETGGYENLLNGDFDGDGFQDDILGYDKNEKTWIVSFSDGKILKNKHLNLKMKNKFANVHTRDFNGDLVEDICFRDLVTGNWIAFDLKEEKQKVIGNWDVKQDWDTVVTGDFNGDEKLDVLGKLHIGKFGWLQVSEFNGKKLENKFYAGPSVNLSENPMLNKHWKWPPHLNVEEVQVADFNGDGLSDFAGKVPGSDSWMFLEIEDKQKSMRRLSSK